MGIDHLISMSPTVLRHRNDVISQMVGYRMGNLGAVFSTSSGNFVRIRQGATFGTSTLPTIEAYETGS